MYAFLVIAALFVVTVLLWLSMRKHLGRIRVDGADEEEPERAAPEAPAPGEQAPPG